MRSSTDTPALDPEETRFRAEFEQRLEDVLLRPSPGELVRPALHASTLSFAVYNHTGEQVWADQKFNQWMGEEALGLIPSKERDAINRTDFHLTKDSSNRPILLVWLNSDLAQSWCSIEPELIPFVELPDVSVLAAVSLSHMADDIEFSARASGLSNLEARVCAALFEHGRISRAAPNAGVTLNTARKAISDAMKKLAVGRQAALLRLLSERSTHTEPSRASSQRVLMDVFGISLREATLAQLLCEGFSRTDAARIAGLSNAVAKDHFRRIFQVLGIESAAELPRLVMGAFAAVLLADSRPAMISKIPQSNAPLKLVRAADGRTIACSDYGPKGGAPVLIVHSSLSTRHPFQVVVKALQQASFRPIVIDRPGFGLTDNMPEPDDRFAAGVDDVVTVCDALGIEIIDVLTRGGTHHVLALARAHPGRLGRIVAINPDLLQQQCSTRKGDLGFVRRAFDRFPSSIEKVALWGASNLSPKRVETLIKMSIGDAGADQKSFNIKQNMEDYARSILAFSTGRLDGFIREQRGYVLQPDVTALDNAKDWHIVLGGSDPIYDLDEVLDIWTSKLPNASIYKIKDAGRFVSLSHTDKIVDILRGGARKR